MHYSVLVVGNDPAEQLSRYNEQLAIPDRHPATRRHYTELVEMYGLRYTTDDARDIAQAEGYEDAEVSPDREVTLLTSFNPDGRWDWWVAGGRWSGLLPTTRKAREAARDNKLEGVDEATLEEVIWNEDTLRLVHSILIEGDWHDLEKGPSEEVTLLEKFHALTSSLDPRSPVLVVDCHT